MHWQTHGAGHAPPPCSTGGVHGSRNQWTQFSIRLSQTTLCSVQEAPCGVTKMQGIKLTSPRTSAHSRTFRTWASALQASLFHSPLPLTKIRCIFPRRILRGILSPTYQAKPSQCTNVLYSTPINLSPHNYKNSFFVTLTVHASIKHSYTFYYLQKRRKEIIACETRYTSATVTQGRTVHLH